MKVPLLRSLHLYSTWHRTSHPPFKWNTCKWFMEQHVIFDTIQGFNSVTKYLFMHYTKISSVFSICVWCDIITFHNDNSSIRNFLKGIFRNYMKEEFPDLEGSWKKKSLNYRPKCSQYLVHLYLHIKPETAGTNLQGYWAPIISATGKLLKAGKLKIWLGMPVNIIIWSFCWSCVTSSESAKFSDLFCNVLVACYPVFLGDWRQRTCHAFQVELQPYSSCALELCSVYLRKA